MDSDRWQRIRREQLEHELRHQDGVVTWAQLTSGGVDSNGVQRALQRREFVRLLPRVYLNHTGTPSLMQRMWAAVLWAEPAAIIHAPSAGPILVAVGPDRRLRPPTSITVHRLRRFEDIVRFGSAPPRLWVEHAGIVRASLAPTERDAVAVLSETIGRMGVTAADVRRALKLHPRLPRRRLIKRLLDDVETGTESVLEHGYLTQVERPHGLPNPARQSPRPGQRRDIEYEQWGLVIELDGRLGHETWSDGNRDADRDLADISAGRTVLRLRWNQVMTDPCRTAAALAITLHQRGWTGVPRPCGPACAVNRGATR